MRVWVFILVGVASVAEGGVPFVRVYDTKAASKAALSGEAVGEREGWEALGEGVVRHAFAGDVVVGHDSLAMVVRKGGRGALRMNITGLAPLFSGHMSAAELLLAGLLDGSERELSRAGIIFSGPKPWMTDNF